MKNPICFWELASHNAEKSVRFFEKVFEWDFKVNEKIGIYEIESGDQAELFSGGGIFTLKKAKLPFLTMYIQVDDIEVKAGMIEKEGGLITIKPFELESGTKICLFNEPSGVTFAMLEPSDANK